MSTQIIDGTKISENIRSEIRNDIESLKTEHGIIPGLGVIIVGEDPASQVYVRMKNRACSEVGIKSVTKKLEADISTAEVVDEVSTLNHSTEVHGILIQLPLPDQIDVSEVLTAVDPGKDVDGLHPENIGRLVSDKPRFVPCTPLGIQIMLIRSGYEIEGKDVVVVGRSNIVGKPLANLLLQKKDSGNATVTVCHSRTHNLASHTRRADILIASVGVPEMIGPDMVSEETIIIDAGINRVDDPDSDKGYKLVGDVAYNQVKDKVKAITPVPGGVGPMTITMLLSNTLRAAQLKIDRQST